MLHFSRLPPELCKNCQENPYSVVMVPLVHSKEVLSLDQINWKMCLDPPQEFANEEQTRECVLEPPRLKTYTIPALSEERKNQVLARLRQLSAPLDLKKQTVTVSESPSSLKAKRFDAIPDILSVFENCHSATVKKLQEMWSAFEEKQVYLEKGLYWKALLEPFLVQLVWLFLCQPEQAKPWLLC